mmetsp:Transcript_19358/g.46768  ORF Transcript_19358/g.46768 Transcript_19358/m.46768 type:complete len:633 (+) Transcript_19358:70-1968(+)
MMHHNNRIKGGSNNNRINTISIRARIVFWLLVLSSTICCCKYYSSHAFHVVVTRPHPQRQQRHHRWGSSSTHPSTLYTISKRLNTESTSHTCLSGSGGSVVNDASNERMSVIGQPNYSLDGGNIDLSKRWIDLVSEGHVKAIVGLPDSNDDQNNCRVEYGVRMVRQQLGSENDTPELYKCEEYVIEAGRDNDNENESSPSSSEPHPLISSINATLSSRQQSSGGSIFKWATSSGGGKGKQGPSSFVAQLQLVRTLRPPPSEGFVGATSNIPPPYNSETDSFVTGPLRLQLRPRVAKLPTMMMNGNDDDDKGEKSSKLSTPWDVYHNVSPADTRGHFLLVPTLDDEDNNWRGQIFTAQDAHDLVWITQSIEPVGSIVIGYNSVGAGASQNHIHCHVWPCPPVPLLSKNRQEQHNPDTDDDDDDTSKGWKVYPVSKVKEIYDFYDIDEGAVEVSYLEYPVFCLLLSASPAHLDLLAKALSTCLDAIGDSPYNIAFLNRKQKVEFETEEIVFDATTVNNDKEREDDETMDFVDVYLFARSKERSDHVPEHKLGVSEMMGVFHAQSEEQLERWASDVVTDTTSVGKVHDEGEEDDDDHDDHHHHGHFNSKGVMYQSLLDVSIENEWEIWETIKKRL